MVINKYCNNEIRIVIEVALNSSVLLVVNLFHVNVMVQN